MSVMRIAGRAAGPPDEAPAPPSAAVAPGEDSLRRRILTGSLWIVMGTGGGHLLRLVRNLALTRLLFPEAFGLVGMAGAVLQGLAMLSDTGVRPSVINSDRGEDPAFLRTAWTVQVLRGAMIFVVAALLAPLVAAYFEEPVLVWIVPALALSTVAQSFESIGTVVLMRRVRPRAQMLLEMGAQIGSLVVVVALAWYWSSVWVLVIAAIVQALFVVVLSWVLAPAPGGRWFIDRDALREILLFGRWVMVATACTFAVMTLDRWVLGRMVDAETLGVYTVALVFSTAVPSVVKKLSRMVLMPVHAELLRRDDPAAMRRAIARARAIVCGATAVPAAILALVAVPLIEFLYDPRYHAAGPMLAILAVGVVPATVVKTAEEVLLAAKDSFRHALFTGWQAITLLGCMIGGWHVGGFDGLLWGIVVARVLEYPAMVVLVRRYGTWVPLVDLPFLAAGGVLAAAVAHL